MAQDNDGNLAPLMLSDLIRIADEVFAEHGDMPVGVETLVPGYEFNEEHSLPVINSPVVAEPSWLQNYWIGRFKRSFVLSGAY